MSKEGPQPRFKVGDIFKYTYARGNAHLIEEIVSITKDKYVIKIILVYQPKSYSDLYKLGGIGDYRFSEYEDYYDAKDLEYAHGYNMKKLFDRE